MFSGPSTVRLWPLLLLLILLTSCAAPKPATPPEKTGPSADDIATVLGIELQGVRFASAGYMMDFRYTVVDPKYAGPMFDDSIIPYLVHEKTGARFSIPNPAKVGPLRSSTEKPKAGKRYFMFFANPGRYVKSGDLVTIVIGPFKFEHLQVQ